MPQYIKVQYYVQKKRLERCKLSKTVVSVAFCHCLWGPSNQNGQSEYAKFLSSPPAKTSTMNKGFLFDPDFGRMQVMGIGILEAG